MTDSQINPADQNGGANINPAPEVSKPKPEKTLAVRLLRGYFPDSGVKLKPGEVHELPLSVAKKLLNSRKAELPDDED